MERTTIEDVNDARLFAAPIPASAGLIINPPPIPTIEPIIVENKPIKKNIIKFSPINLQYFRTNQNCS